MKIGNAGSQIYAPIVAAPDGGSMNTPARSPVEQSAYPVNDFVQSDNNSSPSRRSRRFTPFFWGAAVIGGITLGSILGWSLTGGGDTSKPTPKPNDSDKQTGTGPDGNPIDVTGMRGLHGGSYIKLSSDPVLYKRVMAILNEGIETIEKALGQIDRPWDLETLAHMKQLFGDKADHDDVKAKIKANLEGTYNAMKKHRDNGGRDIYLELVNDAPYVAYSPQDKVGYTGHLAGC
jgi:hypothetical protein